MARFAPSRIAASSSMRDRLWTKTVRSVLSSRSATRNVRELFTCPTSRRNERPTNPQAEVLSSRASGGSRGRLDTCHVSTYPVYRVNVTIALSVDLVGALRENPHHQ